MHSHCIVAKILIVTGSSFKPLVVGSIPTRVTKNAWCPQVLGIFYSLWRDEKPVPRSDEGIPTRVTLKRPQAIRPGAFF